MLAELKGQQNKNSRGREYCESGQVQAGYDAVPECPRRSDAMIRKVDERENEGSDGANRYVYIEAYHSKSSSAIEHTETG